MSDDPITHFLRAAQTRLLAQGMPAAQVIPALAEADAEVRQVFGCARAYIPARGRRHQARDLAIASEYASGHSVARLAARYELSEKQIRRILVAHAALSRYAGA